MSWIQEFKAFAAKGNVVDLAVAVIIGGAFGKIVNSFIDDVITPLILKPALDAANLSKLDDLTWFGTVKYGSFLSAIINFLVIAIVLFWFIKGANKLKKEETAPPPPAEPSNTDKLLMEIRDALKN